MTSSRFPLEVSLRAGQLRHYVTIERRVETQSASGAAAVTWAAFASNVPAGFAYGKGKEVFSAGQEQHQIFVTITIRYLPGVTTKMRVNYNGVFYDITAILFDPTQQSYIDLWCMQGLNAG